MEKFLPLESVLEKSSKKPKRSLIVVIFIGSMVTVSTGIWIRLPRSFGFVRDNGGVGVPCKWSATADVKKTAGLDDVICYGFTGDPRKLRKDMNTELKLGNWVPMIGEEPDGTFSMFSRCDLTPGQHNGIPTQQVSNFTDNASLEKDSEIFVIPSGMTSLVWVNRRTNLSEMVFRFQHRNDPPRNLD